MNAVRVSMVRNAVSTATRDANAAKIVEHIRAGKWRARIEKIRKTYSEVLTRTGDAKAAKLAIDPQKKKLPGVLWSGRFSSRKKPASEKLIAHSGLLCADADDLGERLPEVRAKLVTSPHLFALFTSPSGQGIKAVFRVPPDAERHGASFCAVEKHVHDLTGVQIDGACKDVARLCFVSSDRQAVLNAAAVELRPLETRRTMPAVASAGPDLDTRHRIAIDLLGPVTWTGATRGLATCPGQHLHTTSNGARDCEIHLDGAPTIHCFHGSCAGIRDALNRELRSRVGKAEWRSSRRSTATDANGACEAPADASDFDKVTAGVRGGIVAMLLDKDLTLSQQRREICGLVVDALCRTGRLYFHAERRDFDTAMFFDAHEKRLLRIRGDAFLAWLSEWLRINRADGLFKHVIAEVETAALASQRTTAILPEAFWAARPGSIYLSSGDGQAAKITPAGVAVVDNGTDGILFSAGRTLAPWKLTEPRDPFATCALFRNAHSTATHGPDLLRLWLYSLPSNPRSKPPLCLVGEVGSGKTRLAKGFAELYGLPFVAHKVEEAAESDFWPCCDDGGIFTLDNADTRCRWLADAVANAATDGCSKRRKLYTNAETVILRAHAWLCVTTANPTFAADSGLADRLLLVRMSRRDEETRDAALTDQILAARDAGLSHLAATLRKALADTAPTPPGLNARHPDFGAFAVRIGRALGREAEAVAALKAAEADKSAFCVENDSIGSALLAYLRQARTFTGTAAELVPHLCEVDGDLKDRLSARRLARRLGAIWPHLQGVLELARREPDRKGFLVFSFKSAESADFADSEMVFS